MTLRLVRTPTNAWVASRTAQVKRVWSEDQPAAPDKSNPPLLGPQQTRCYHSQGTSARTESAQPYTAFWGSLNSLDTSTSVSNKSVSCFSRFHSVLFKLDSTVHQKEAWSALDTVNVSQKIVAKCGAGGPSPQEASCQYGVSTV